MRSRGAVPSVPLSVEEPVRTNAVNVGGTVQVLDAARRAGVRRVVYAASSSAYGESEALPKVETMPAAPVSPYALQKYAGELYCRLYYELYGLETVALRYFNVYGPRQDPRSTYAAVIPRFVSACVSGVPPTVHGDVEGLVQGSIVALPGSQALVRVLGKGRVEGEINAPNVVINGSVQGDVRSSRQLDLAPKGRVDGNVYYNLVEMSAGAEVNGSLSHVGPGHDEEAQDGQVQDG